MIETIEVQHVVCISLLVDSSLTPFTGLQNNKTYFANERTFIHWLNMYAIRVNQIHIAFNLCLNSELLQGGYAWLNFFCSCSVWP